MGTTFMREVARTRLVFPASSPPLLIPNTCKQVLDQGRLRICTTFALVGLVVDQASSPVPAVTTGHQHSQHLYVSSYSPSVPFASFWPQYRKQASSTQEKRHTERTLHTQRDRREEAGSSIAERSKKLRNTHTRTQRIKEE